MAGFVFYEDYYKVSKQLLTDDADKLKFYEAIFRRGLYNEPFERTGNMAIDTAFIFAESLISANEKKRIDGAKGGRPKKETKTTGKPLVSVKENVNGNAKANANNNSNSNNKCASPVSAASPDRVGNTASEEEIDWGDDDV